MIFFDTIIICKKPLESGLKVKHLKANICYSNVPAMARLKKRRCTMYAIIETGGKQYRVQEGDSIRVEKLNFVDGDTIKFDKVLLVANDSNLNVGKPYVDGAVVEAKVEKQGKNKKIIVFKYKPKKDFRNKKGHRQPYTQVKIEKIVC